MDDIITTSTINPPAVMRDLGSLAESWIRFLDASSSATVATYSRGIRPFIAHVREKGISIEGLSRNDIIAYKDALRAKGLRPSTITLYINCVRLLCQWLVAEGVLVSDVSIHIKGEKVGRGHKRDFLPVEGIRKTLDSIDRSTLHGKRDYALILLAVTDGLRTVEIARADIADLREEAGDTVLYVQGKGRSADKSEFVRVNGKTYQAIRDYLSARKAKDAAEPLFASLARNAECPRLTTRSVSEICKTRMVSAGYDSARLTAHSLRHSACTLALKAGMPIDSVRQFMRHSSINTTLIYSHALEAHENEGAATLENVLFA